MYIYSVNSHLAIFAGCCAHPNNTDTSYINLVPMVLTYSTPVPSLAPGDEKKVTLGTKLQLNP